MGEHSIFVRGVPPLTRQNVRGVPLGGRPRQGGAPEAEDTMTTWETYRCSIAKFRGWSLEQCFLKNVFRVVFLSCVFFKSIFFLFFRLKFLLVLDVNLLEDAISDKN